MSVYRPQVWDKIAARIYGTGDDVSLALCGDSNMTSPNPNGRYGYIVGLMNALGDRISGHYVPPTRPNIDAGQGANSSAGYDDWSTNAPFDVNFNAGTGVQAGGEDVASMQAFLDRDANTVSGTPAGDDLLTIADMFFATTFGKNDGPKLMLFPSDSLWHETVHARWMVSGKASFDFTPRIRDFDGVDTAGDGTLFNASNVTTINTFEVSTLTASTSDYTEAIRMEWGSGAASETGPCAMYGMTIRRATIAGGARICPLHFFPGSESDHFARAMQRVNDGFFGWWPDEMTQGQSDPMLVPVVSLETNRLAASISRADSRTNMQTAIEQFRSRTISESSTITSNDQMPVVFISPHPRKASATEDEKDDVYVIGEDMRTVTDAVGNACVVDLALLNRYSPLADSLYAGASTTHLTEDGYDQILGQAILNLNTSGQTQGVTEGVREAVREGVHSKP